MSDVITPTCCHVERVEHRPGLWRFVHCTETPVEQVEGWWFCWMHEPPGPKVA